MNSVLRWPGGKRKLLKQLSKHIPSKITLHEPFVGSGSVFLGLNPPTTFISDLNSELINFYKQVKESPDVLISILKTYKNTKEFYYDMRELDRFYSYQNICPIKKAARFFYLNKTCFNGLVRYNKKNQYNVPYGYRKNIDIVCEKDIHELSLFLKKVNILDAQSYEYSLYYPERNEFVYLDPPYHKTFTDYTSEGFDSNDQINLAKECHDLHDRGVFFAVSNSGTPLIREIYSDFYIHKIDAKQIIAAKKEARGIREELLITNFQKKALFS